ncbi:hypothetical protein SD78_2883 [Bacillus badius]|nr:hypothetical protein SD78_2883 [Bacillus badius]TDW01562.1 hypothetical protein B0G66_1108 [Bacillus badius]
MQRILSKLEGNLTSILVKMPAMQWDRGYFVLDKAAYEVAKKRYLSFKQ